MPDIVLEQEVANFVELQIAAGKFIDASDLVNEAIRFLKETHEAIDEGLADVEAGRVHDADEVFSELIARYERLEKERSRA